MIRLANGTRSISSVHRLRILSLHVRQPMEKITIIVDQCNVTMIDQGLSVFVQSARRMMEGIISVPIHEPMRLFKFSKEIIYIRIGYILLMLVAESILLRKGIISKNRTTFACPVSSCANIADKFIGC